MRLRTIFLLVVAFGILVGIVEIVGRAVSGGEKTFLRAAAVLKTNSFILGRVGSPVTAVTHDGGPERVVLGTDGRRHGLYSVKTEGPMGEESLKVYWCDLPGGTLQVYAIYRTKPWAQDELVWGAPRTDLN